MRTTLRIEDDLLAEVRKRSATEGLSIAEVVNRLLRGALRRGVEEERRPRKFRERVASMGEPRADLTKALQIAGAMEDAETVRKLSLRK